MSEDRFHNYIATVQNCVTRENWAHKISAINRKNLRGRIRIYVRTALIRYRGNFILGMRDVMNPSNVFVIIN